MKLLAFCGAGLLAIAMSGCSGSGGKDYDISAIFPLSAGKCAKYHGDQKGSGFSASCLVTKDECEKAAADWRAAMQQGYVNDAIQFSCK